MLSIITPTHNPQFLAETHASLQLQGNMPFEWVITPSPEVAGRLPDSVLADSRVRVVPYVGEPLIGAIKRFAFGQGLGDVLIELDHDDILLPGALAAIQRQADLGADFIYSDTASFMDDTKVPVLYDPAYGWRNYPMDVYGRTFYAAESFDVTARSLCDLAFAPDHVRCWTRKAYEKLGGHDCNMVVGDDHDLICRTYLAGMKFASTGACHYLYRIHNDNTVFKRHSMIQQQSWENRSKYLRPLVSEWSRRRGYPGCYVNGWLDDWQPQDNSLTVVVSTNVMHSWTLVECIRFMNTAYRALIPGGWLLIDVPSATDESPPNCRSYHSPESFEWFTNSEFASLDPRITCRFQAVNVLNEPAQGDVPGWSVRADLMALKGQVSPGLCKI
jgi:hypothetical protein